MTQPVPPYPSGPPPGGYGPPQPYGQGRAGEPAPPLDGTARSSGTNTMAVLAVVFAFLFSPLGIVFGIVGRRQTARTGQGGRGLATTGLVLSVVFLALGVAAVVSATVLTGALLSSVPTTPDAPEAPASSVAPAGATGSTSVTVQDGEYGPEVPADDLAAQVGAATGAQDVICPGYLPAEVGASTTCSATVDGAPAQLQTTVSAVQDGEASVEVGPRPL